MRNRIPKTLLSVVVAAALTITSVVPVSAAGTSETQSLQREKESNEIARQAAEEGMVLLDNSGAALPITASSPTQKVKVALYGFGVYGTIRGGTGSGATNPKPSAYWDVFSAFKDADYDIVNESFLLEKKAAAAESSQRVYDEGEYKLSDIQKAAKETDTAIYVLTRDSGEGNDRNLVKGDYYLYDSEYKNLQKLADTFAHVIVVLNVGGIIDTNFYHGLSDEVNVREVKANGTLVEREQIEGLDSLFLMSQGGLEGGNALVNVLNGKVTPSGKLTDTWAINYEDYPSAAKFSHIDLSAKDTTRQNTAETLEEIYNDDIYVGYRYFDTYGVEVAYPFGYGQSYADFAIQVTRVTADANEVKVQAEVTNASATDITGKEVVQVYFSAPTGAGKLDKPFQELAGYAKTKAIGKGQKDSVTITFDTKDMSSYDESTGAYVMDAGDYIIRVGNSSRNTIVAKTLHLDEKVVTEQYENQLGVTRNELISGNYPEGTVLNNTYTVETVQGWWGPQEREVGTPHYDAKTQYSILTGNVNGSSIVPGSVGLSLREGFDASSTLIDITSKAKPAYEKGDVTTYVSPDQNTDSAKYAKEEKKNFRWSGSEKKQTVEATEKAANKLTLVDVVNGDITVEQLVANMSNIELVDLVEGGTYSGLTPDIEGQGPMIGSQADSVPGAAGETTKNLYTTRYIPNIVLSDGPAGIRITPNYTDYIKVAENAEFNESATYYTMEMVERPNWWGGTSIQAEYTKASVTASDFAQKVKEGNGLYTAQNYYQYCTAIPIGTLMAQTWNKELIEKVGRQIIGREMLEYSVTSYLAPGMNIHRNPLCGRNFEYYSEDPLITGMSAASMTKGIQTDKSGNYSGVGVTIKHFAFNNQENSRNGSNSVVSERAAREIYLKGFEIVVRNAEPDYVMSSYNMVNGYPTYTNYALLTRMLRDEWGFDGFVMTDWGSVGTVFGKYKDANINVQGMLMYTGNDCEMPGGSVDSLVAALEEGKDVRLGDLQKSAINMLNVIKRSAIFKKLQKLLMTSSETLQESLDKVNEQITELQGKLDEAQAAYDELKNNADASKEALKAAEDQITDLNNQIQAAKDEAAQQIKDLEDKFEEAKSDLAATNAALKEATDNLEALQNDLVAANKDAADKLAAANKELAAANDKIAEANDKLVAANKEAADKLAAANEKLEAANKEAADKLEAANKEAADKLAAANKEAADKLAAANKEATDNLAAANKEAADRLQEANDKVVAANKELQAANDKVTAANDKVTAANKEADEKVAAAKKDADEKVAAAKKDADEKLAALEKKLEEAMKNQGSQGGQNTPAVKVVTDKSKYKVKVKKSVKIAALASDGSKLTYKSNKPNVAKVTKNGKVKGKKKGTAKITVTSASGASVTVTVKVKK